MTNTTLPEAKRIGAGYYELQFNDFKHFVDYVYSDMMDFESYIWRGQRCDTWALEPTLDRLIRSLDSPVKDKVNWAKKHLESFKYAARGRRGSNPPAITNENDWWALGQHHGLPTPLLDWSNSPFVAAFFAFAEAGSSDQTSNRAIVALSQPIIEEIVDFKVEAEESERRQTYERKRKAGTLGLLDAAFSQMKAQPEIEFIRPLSDENSRLVSQRGLFTRSNTALSIEDWVQKNYTNEDSLVLIKFLIPDIERTKCLQLLNRMNINPLSLFPDLSGASQYCTLLSQIKNY